MEPVRQGGPAGLHRADRAGWTGWVERCHRADRPRRRHSKHRAYRPAGQTGPAGSNAVSGFAYIYNQRAEVVAIEAAIAFDTNGPLLGVTHAPGNAGIVLTSAGVYRVSFIVSGAEHSSAAAVTLQTLADGTQTNVNASITIERLS